MKIINISLIITLVFILGACSNINLQNNSNQEKQQKTTPVSISQLKRVNLSQFKEEIAKKDAIIIDLRTTQELEDTGIIEGAIQIDYYSSDFEDQLNLLDKTKKYLIYCRSGGRSSKTLALMKKLGFTNVLELDGGMNGWLSAGEKTTPFKINNKKESTNNLEVKAINEIVLNAKNWQFDQKVIKVKKGERVIIKVNNLDGLHGIAVPSMRVVGDEQIEIDTSVTGEFQFVCANYCGQGHANMIGKIIVS